MASTADLVPAADRGPAGHAEGVVSEWRPYEPSREAEAADARHRFVAVLVAKENEFSCDRCKAKACSECEEWCES